MSLLDELRDPWGLLVAAGSGGFAWATGLDALPAAAIGGVVLAVKVVSGVLSSGRRERGGAAVELKITQGSPEEAWLRRCERAAASLRDVAESANPGPVAYRLQTVVGEAAATVQDMRRIAGQTSAVTAAMHRIDLPTLQRDRASLQRVLDSGNAATHDDARRSLASVDSQLAVHQRLYGTASEMLVRMQSGTIAMETLLAHVAELVTMSGATPDGVDSLGQLDVLVADLEGLRLGLEETEEMTRKALGAYDAAPAPVFRKDDRTARDRGRAGPLEGGS
ncbi:MAG TPA: hypothetical protein VEZ46_05890 [Mycobacteriales bacterium]|jgi:hypothetical protein|nr:hypothetical protein [Mycobacteriales bacterium]